MTADRDATTPRATCDELAALGTATVSDALDRLGLPGGALQRGDGA
jgi:hypothetical protein